MSQQLIWIMTLIGCVFGTDVLSDTVFITNCDGMVRILPNHDLNMNFMFEKLPSLYNNYLNGIARELKTGCTSVSRTDEEWEELVYQRYDFITALLSPTKKGFSDFVDLCPGGQLPKHTRDLTGVLRSLIGNTSITLPETCNYDTWINEGTCGIASSIPEIDRTVMTINARRCPAKSPSVPNKFFEIAVTCRGLNCETFMSPCNSTSQCGSDQECISDITTYSEEIKSTFFSLFETLRVYTKSAELSPCSSPNKFFKSILSGMYYSTGLCLPSKESKDSIQDIWKIFNVSDVTIRKDVFAGCTNIKNSILNLHNSVFEYTASLTYNAWKVFPYYDHYTGASVFQHQSGWAEWPTLSLPVSGHHILTTDCSGVVYAFLGSPYSFQMYAPKLPVMLQIFSEFSYEIWKCERIFQQLDYTTAQALWRIEPYLKVFTDPVISKRFPSPSLYADFFGHQGDSYCKITNLSLGDWYFDKTLSGTISAGDPEMEIVFQASEGGSQCTTHGFVDLLVTCQGAHCDDLFLRNLCSDESGCSSFSECRCLDGLYESSSIATELWASPDFRPKSSSDSGESSSASHQPDTGASEPYSIDYANYLACPNLMEADSGTLFWSNPNVDPIAWRLTVYEFWKDMNTADMCGDRSNCTGCCQVDNEQCVQRMNDLTFTQDNVDVTDITFCIPLIPNSGLVWTHKTVDVPMMDYLVNEYPLSPPRFASLTVSPVVNISSHAPLDDARLVVEKLTSYKTEKIVIAVVICTVLIVGTIICLTTILARRRKIVTDSTEDEEKELADDRADGYDHSKQGDCFPDQEDEQDIPV